MRRMRRGAGLLVLASALAGCANGLLGDGGSVGNADWSLEGMNPEGDRLLVAVPFGGVASGCARFEGWEVEIDDETVSVVARLWRASSGDCTDELVVEVRQIELDRPLGERTLRGCGRDDCLRGFEPYDRGLIDPGRLVVAGPTIAVQNSAGLDLYDADGASLASTPGAASGPVVGLADGTVVRTPGPTFDSSVGHDGGTADARWRAEGWTVATGSDAVYLCRGEEDGGLVAIDPSTGRDRWASDLPCGGLEIDGRFVSVISDRDVDGGNRIVVGDAATGARLLDEPIFDGIDDQVEAFDGQVRWGELLVTSGPQADLVVIDRDGREVDRWAEPVGSPAGVIDDDVLVSVWNGRGVFAHDLTTAAEVWRIDVVDPWERFVFDAGSAWLLAPDGGSVSRIAPRTGEAMWETPIGSTTRFDAALAGDVVIVLTTQSLLAFDNESGEIRWSVDRPHVG